jgi:hypothetical protein
MTPAALGLYGLITFVQTIEWVEIISSSDGGLSSTRSMRCAAGVAHL